MLLAAFGSGFASSIMLYQLQTYGYWEAKGAKVDGVVGYGIAYFFAAIFIFMISAIFKDWRRG